MKVSGILRRLRSKFVTTPVEEEKKLWDSVPLQAVGPIILIPFFGIILSMLIVILEIIIQRKFNHLNNSEYTAFAYKIRIQ